jgi:bacterioferritin-associated ferredoxin
MVYMRVEIEERRAMRAVPTDIARSKRTEEDLQPGNSRLEKLLELYKPRDAPQPHTNDFALDAALGATQSGFAFIGPMNNTKTVMTIHAWSKESMAQCALEGKPLRFPIAQAGLCGECVRQRRSFIANDYNAPHPHKRGCPAAHFPIHRFWPFPLLPATRNQTATR